MSSTVRPLGLAESRFRPAWHIPGDPPGPVPEDRNLQVRPVGIRSACAIAAEDIGVRARKPSPDVGFRDIVAAERDPVADAVERLVRGTNGHIVQDDQVVCPPRGRHVVENAGTGKRGLPRCVLLRLSATRRRLSASRAACPAVMLPAMASGSMTSTSQNQVVRVRLDLPHPLGPATTKRVAMGSDADRVRRTSARAD